MKTKPGRKPRMGEYAADYRGRPGWNYRRIANAMGLSITTIGRYERQLRQSEQIEEGE